MISTTLRLCRRLPQPQLGVHPVSAWSRGFLWDTFCSAASTVRAVCRRDIGGREPFFEYYFFFTEVSSAHTLIASPFFRSFAHKLLAAYIQSQSFNGQSLIKISSSFFVLLKKWRIKSVGRCNSPFYILSNSAPKSHSYNVLQLRCHILFYHC